MSFLCVILDIYNINGAIVGESWSIIILVYFRNFLSVYSFPTFVKILIVKINLSCMNYSEMVREYRKLNKEIRDTDLKIRDQIQKSSERSAARGR